MWGKKNSNGGAGACNGTAKMTKKCIFHVPFCQGGNFGRGSGIYVPLRSQSYP